MTRVIRALGSRYSCRDRDLEIGRKPYGWRRNGPGAANALVLPVGGGGGCLVPKVSGLIRGQRALVFATEFDAEITWCWKAVPRHN